MIVLMPTARIVAKKLWSTGTDKSTASIRGSLAQYSLACAVGAHIARPANNRQMCLADLAAEAPKIRTGKVPPTCSRTDKAHYALLNQSEVIASNQRPIAVIINPMKPSIAA